MKKYFTFRSNKRGFTLLEVSLTIGILAVITLSGAALIKSYIRLYNEREAGYEAFQNARLAMNRIVEELRKYTELTYADGGITGYRSKDSSEKVYILSDGTAADKTKYLIYYDAASQSLLAGAGKSGVYADCIKSFSVLPGQGPNNSTICVAIVPSTGYQDISTELRADRCPQ